MKRKTYKEPLLWSIIIILVMFIVVLDAIWFRENHIEKVNQEDTLKSSEVWVTFMFASMDQRDKNMNLKYDEATVLVHEGETYYEAYKRAYENYIEGSSNRYYYMPSINTDGSPKVPVGYIFRYWTLDMTSPSTAVVDINSIPSNKSDHTIYTVIDYDEEHTVTFDYNNGTGKKQSYNFSKRLNTKAVAYQIGSSDTDDYYYNIDYQYRQFNSICGHWRE